MLLIVEGDETIESVFNWRGDSVVNLAVPEGGPRDRQPPRPKSISLARYGTGRALIKTHLPTDTHSLCWRRRLPLVFFPPLNSTPSILREDAIVS